MFKLVYAINYSISLCRILSEYQLYRPLKRVVSVLVSTEDEAFGSSDLLEKHCFNVNQNPLEELWSFGLGVRCMFVTFFSCLN
jgi:hypothetical protein